MSLPYQADISNQGPINTGREMNCQFMFMTVVGSTIFVSGLVILSDSGAARLAQQKRPEESFTGDRRKTELKDSMTWSRHNIVSLTRCMHFTKIDVRS